MNALLFAIQFLTRIPIPFQYSVTANTQQQAFYWHGFVGLIIGFILLITYWIASWLFPASPFLVATILLIKWVAITGALHLDGLGDSADAWLGGYGDKNKTLAIMKDPTSGPAAIVWIVLVLLLKLGALLSIVNQDFGYALLLTPMIGRLASMTLFATTDYVRKNGLATPFINGLKKDIVFLQLTGAILCILLVTGIKGISALLFATISAFYLRHIMIKRIQGTTGDTAGALIECVEAAVLLGFSIRIF